jgi:vacuolar-type H+-ATPase subunit H
MNLDILNFLYRENEYGIFFIISFIVVICVIYYKFKINKIYEPFFKKIKKAVSSAASSIDPTKIINDAMKSAKKLFTDLLGEAKKPFDKFVKDINKTFNKIKDDINGIPEILSKAADDATDLLNDALIALEEAITAPMRGIDEMISDFKKLMCLLESFPTRISNLISGIDNIFQGIDEQMQLILKAASLGLKETSTLANYTSLFLNTYIKCGIQFIGNIHKCFFFYLVDIIGKVLYLPVRIVLWFLKLYFDIDFYPIEKRIWNGISYIDQIIYSTLDMHIMHFPETIRTQCYTCIRLKKDVVNRQAKVVEHTFNEKIPDMINGEITNVGMAKIKRGRRLLREITAMPQARPPNRVE